MPGVPHMPGTREYLTCESGEIVLAVAGEQWRLRGGRRGGVPRATSATRTATRGSARRWVTRSCCWRPGFEQPAIVDYRIVIDRVGLQTTGRDDSAGTSAQGPRADRLVRALPVRDRGQRQSSRRRGLERERGRALPRRAFRHSTGRRDRDRELVAPGRSAPPARRGPGRVAQSSVPAQRKRRKGFPLPARLRAEVRGHRRGRPGPDPGRASKSRMRTGPTRSAIRTSADATSGRLTAGGRRSGRPEREHGRSGQRAAGRRAARSSGAGGGRRAARPSRP